MYLSSSVDNLDLVLLSMVSERLCEGAFNGWEVRVDKDIFNKLDHHG